MHVSSEYGECITPGQAVPLHCAVTDLLKNTTKWTFNGISVTSDCHINGGFINEVYFSKCDIDEGLFHLVIKSFNADENLGTWSCNNEGRSKAIDFGASKLCC